MIPSHLRQLVCYFDSYDRPKGIAAMAVWIREELAGCIPPDASVISIDGLDGVCKTTMGEQLSHALQIGHVDLDQHLRRKQGMFLEAINFSDLKQALSDAVADQGGVIVTGCIMDEALKRCGVSSDYRIYAMRTRPWSIGQGQLDDIVREREILYGEATAEAYIRAEEKELRRYKVISAERDGTDLPRLSGLTRELIHYHMQSRPHDDADLIVKVREHP